MTKPEQLSAPEIPMDERGKFLAFAAVRDQVSNLLNRKDLSNLERVHLIGILDGLAARLRALHSSSDSAGDEQ